EDSRSTGSHALVDDAVISDAGSSSSPAVTKEAVPGFGTKSLHDETTQKSDGSAESSRSAADAFGDTHHSRSAYGAGGSVHLPFASAPASNAEKTRGKEAFGEALQVAGGGDPSVLASNETPVLSADIRGPKQILVGRESVYKVRLQNQSDIPA